MIAAVESKGKSDEVGTEPKRALIKNLRLNQDWLEKKAGADWRPEDGATARNILVGTIQSINQCGRSVKDWLDRKDGRRDHLTRIRKTYPTRRGNRVLQDLLVFAISELEACIWRDQFWVGALPLRRKPRQLSEAHKHALCAGRDRAERRKREMRKARLEKEATH